LAIFDREMSVVALWVTGKVENACHSVITDQGLLYHNLATIGEYANCAFTAAEF
jgi:hypothetical protein